MKEKFLKDLEKKISVLSEEEIRDIIDEYSNIIDDKVKHGKTIEEAVQEFGDIKELSKEILKAYKIDPDYNKNNFSEKTNDFIKSSEDFIKKGAQKLSDVTEDVVESIKGNNNEFETTQVFEIIIKVVLVLLCLAVLKIPFYIISSLGQGVFNFGTFPFGGISGVAWKIFIELAYLAVCALIIITVVSKYTSVNKKTVKKDKPETVKKEKIVESKKEESVKKNNSNDGVSTFLIILVRVWSVILVLIPLWLIQFGLIVAICFVIYLLIKGISIYGILLLLIGVSGMIGFLCDIIWKLLFNRGKLHIYPIFINIALIFLGGLLTFDYFANLEYINKLPENIKLTSSVYEEKIDSNLNIPSDYLKQVDNSLEDNKIRIEITYYDGIYDNVDVDIRKIVDDDGSTGYIKIKTDYNNDTHIFNRKIYNIVIRNLKEDILFNYSLMNDIDVTIYANENTFDMLK